MKLIASLFFSCVLTTTMAQFTKIETVVQLNYSLIADQVQNSTEQAAFRSTGGIIVGDSRREELFVGKPGIKISAAANIPLSNKWAFVTSLRYDQMNYEKTTNYNFNSEFQGVNITSISNTIENVNLGLISISPQIRYHITPQFSVTTGLSMGTLMTATVDESTYLYNAQGSEPDIVSFEQSTTEGTTKSKKEFQTSQYAISASFWYVIFENIGIELSYSRSLTPIYLSDHRILDKSYVNLLSIGARYQINLK